MRTRSFTIVQKLAALGTVGLLGTIVTGGAGLVAIARYHDLSDQLHSKTRAQNIIRELDTRASELKVDGYKAIVRPKAADEVAEFVEDSDKITTRLAKLAALDLPAADRQRVENLSATFQDYIERIDAFVKSAIADQAKARANWETIQKANDATDEAVGNAEEAFDVSATATAREQDRLGTSLRMIILSTLALSAASVAALAGILARGIGRRVRYMTGVLSAAADGDLTVRASVQVQGSDEIGSMGRSVDRLLERVGSLMGTLTLASRDLDSASQNMKRMAAAVSTSAQSASSQTQVVAVSAADVSDNVRTVAAGAQEMGTSINEIARNSQDAAQVATNAVKAVEETTTRMRQLGESSQEIGDVIRLITSIAEQTNLLALNATIEAARAGDAGKGFAVVADEVKQLAQETARATEDISRRVQAIQGDAEGAASAIGDIASVISRIHEFQTTIAGAVEEQTTTTSHINANIADAANGSTQIATNMTGIADAVTQTAGAMEEALHNADKLALTSTELLHAVKGFRF